MKFENIVFVILATSFKLTVLFMAIDVALILAGEPPLHMVVIGLALTCAVSAFIYGGMIFTGGVDLKASFNIAEKINKIKSAFSRYEIILFIATPCAFYIPIHVAHIYLPKWWDMIVGFSVAIFLIYRVGLWYLKAKE